ncbi:MAG: amidohydrolase, partial [Candidatus Promineifilaceae bacterium]|nr:amidohydrolase [Candidatus Promineifilaceae bacterium]
VLQRISDFAKKKEIDARSGRDRLWLQGRGWTNEAWRDKSYPTAERLDRIVPNLPACLYHKSGHAAWVNSLALKIAGITASTNDPEGGQIQRDAGGKPTGILFEEAIDLVADHIPRPTVAEIADAMLDAQAYCWQTGLTGLHDFDGRSCFQALQSLQEQNQLGLRIVKNIPVYRLDHALGVGLRSGFGNEWLRIGGIKIFADGALGPRTASMVEPYENEPNNFGIVVTDKEQMMSNVSQASAGGLSVTIHAIGDKANHDVLDVYEAVRGEEARGNRKQLRHRIEHVQLLHPADLNRLAELNVIASMQPIHATSDMEIADSNWGGRARYSYAWRTMLQSGTTLVFGSDAPVEKIDPLPGIHAAVTRCRADGSPGSDGWYPEQKLTLWETMRAFTLAAAETSGQENLFGSIKQGKLADMTIFDRDIFSLSTHELLEAAIAGTIVGGRFKYRTIG